MKAVMPVQVMPLRQIWLSGTSIRKRFATDGMMQGVMRKWISI